MIRSFMILFAAVFVLAGCNNPSYINVPNDGHDFAINDPNQLTVKAIQSVSLGFLINQSAIPGDIGISFPEGTSDRTAMSIVADLPENVFVVGMTPSDEYQLIEIREISARGGIGRVDIIRPGSLRAREFVEVHLRWDFWDGWIAERIRVRNIDVNRIDANLQTAPDQDPAFEEVAPPEGAADDAPEDTADAPDEAPDDAPDDAPDEAAE